MFRGNWRYGWLVGPFLGIGAYAAPASSFPTGSPPKVAPSAVHPTPAAAVPQKVPASTASTVSPASPRSVPREAVHGEEVLPPPSTEDLKRRARHLLEAIAQDSPDLARDILFPRDAFRLSHERGENPRAWERMVEAPFARSIKHLHLHQKKLHNARLVSIEVIGPMGQIIPKKKEWKAPLWRAKRARLVLSVEGRPEHMLIAEMVAWKGSWYVTRLR